MSLERWHEATVRLVEAVNRDPDYVPLSDLAARLVVEHPAPGELRNLLDKMLAQPEHRRAAAVFNPLLTG
jgi:hypothetical protein